MNDDSRRIESARTGVDGALGRAFERAFDEVDRLLDAEASSDRLSSEITSLEPEWLELSRGLEERLVEGESPRELFAWSSEGWREPGLASTRGVEARPSPCIRGLVDDLLEEERVGAWAWERPDSSPTQLRLRAMLDAVEGEAPAEVEVRLRASKTGARVEVEVQVAAGGAAPRSVCLARGSTEWRASAGGVNLSPDQLDGLEVRVEGASGRPQRLQLPVTGVVG